MLQMHELAIQDNLMLQMHKLARQELKGTYLHIKFDFIFTSANYIKLGQSLTYWWNDILHGIWGFNFEPDSLPLKPPVEVLHIKQLKLKLLKIFTDFS